MRKNQVRAKLLQGEAVVNAWLAIPSSLSAEGLSHQGFDSITIDMQHGAVFYDTALPMLQAISTTTVTPMARVPWNEPGIIMKTLDAGAMGIVCPMINNGEECAAFVGACRYPPKGYRSYGPTRVRLYAGDDYAAHANSEVLTFAMIETAPAMENLDAIMSVPGLDGIYVGPADLSQNLGGPPGSDWEKGPVVKALDKILAAAERHKIIAGIHTGSPAYARKMIKKGFRFVTVSSDLGILLDGAKRIVTEVRGEAKPLKRPKGKGPY